MKNQVEVQGYHLTRVIQGPDKLESDDDTVKGVIDSLRYELYYRGSAMVQANRAYSHSVGSLYYRPVSFRMPSAQFLDSRWMAYQPREAKPPSYVVKGTVELGGRYDSTSTAISYNSVGTDLEFDGVTFENVFSLQYFNSIYNIKFSECVFPDGFAIKYSELFSIEFINCKFTEEVIIHNSKIKKLIFTSCDIHKMNITIDAKTGYTLLTKNDFSHRIDSLSLKDCCINDLSILGKNVKEIITNNINIKKCNMEFETNNIKIIEKSPSPLKFNSLVINWISEEADTVSIIDNFTTDMFYLNGRIRKSSFTISNVTCKNLIIEDFNNEGNFRISNFKSEANGTVDLRRSQLGKADFNTVDFSEALSFKMHSISISEMTTHDV